MLVDKIVWNSHKYLRFALQRVLVNDAKIVSILKSKMWKPGLQNKGFVFSRLSISHKSTLYINCRNK